MGLVGSQLINAAAGLEFFAGDGAVKLIGADEGPGLEPLVFDKLRNSVAGLVLKGTMLFSCWHLNLSMLLQCWDCRVHYCL